MILRIVRISVFCEVRKVIIKKNSVEQRRVKSQVSKSQAAKMGARGSVVG
jgi:hypothetical protein